jgi:nicotinamide-nucleotide amidase
MDTTDSLLAQLVARVMTLRGGMLVTAESCTGGGLAWLLTSIPGSSAWFERGFITYSNDSKQELLGIPADLLLRHGAVSEQTAAAMASGAIAKSHAAVSVAITGIAGPDGGTPEKPVGLVHFAVAVRDGETQYRFRRFGDLGRSAVRLAAVGEALAMLNRAAQAAVAP